MGLVRILPEVRAEAGRCNSAKRTWMLTAETTEEARQGPRRSILSGVLGKTNLSIHQGANVRIFASRTYV